MGGDDRGRIGDARQWDADRDGGGDPLSGHDGPGPEREGRRSLLAAIAEDAGAYRAPLPSETRVLAPDVLLIDRSVGWGYWYHQASRIRFRPDEADRRIDEVRRWFAERGCRAWSWSIGPSATPSDVGERLRRLGAVSDPDGGRFAGMVLDREPPRSSARIEIRRVETLADYVLYAAVGSEAYDESPEDRAASEATIEQRWREAAVTDDAVAFLALQDGEPVGAAAMVHLEPGPWLLIGGATVPRARGRGVYRALVRARWDEAAARGGGSLVVQAGRMSAPILERLGFESICSVEVLVEQASEA